MEEDILKSIQDKLRKSTPANKRQDAEYALCGTLATRDCEKNLPYYVVKYDGGNRVRFIARNVSREFLSDSFLALIFAVREIETLVNPEYALSIDFGVLLDGTVQIFDIIELPGPGSEKLAEMDRDFLDTKAFAKCNYLDTNHVLSDMAYWGTAEVVGTNPRPLDYSLYRAMITDRVWSRAICPLGYNLVHECMMQRIGNKPYNSVDRTMLALTPSEISGHTVYKLHSYYHSLLRSNRNLHGNIEHTLLMSCCNFSTRDRMERLRVLGFSDEEIKEISDALMKITVNSVRNQDEWNERDAEEIGHLTELTDRIAAENPLEENNIMRLYRNVGELLNTVREFGTPPYARQSRFASIARDICESLVKQGYVEEDNPYGLPGGAPTIEKQLGGYIQAVAEGKMTQDYFMTRFGHLRKDNFNIRSASFRELDFKELESRGMKALSKPYEPFGPEIFEQAVKDAGMPISAEQLCNFVKQAPKKNLEYKYEFSKALSLMLDCFVSIGRIMGIAREDMSYLEISDLLDYHSRDSYIQIIGERRNLYHAYSRLVLPEIIFNVGDIDNIDFECTAESREA